MSTVGAPGRGVRLIHGEPDGSQINNAFSSSISWRDPSWSMTTIHRCYTSPCDSRSDLGTTSEVVFTNNSPLLLSSALTDDSPPLPSSTTRCRCPRRRLAAAALGGLHQQPSPTSFADVPRRRLIVTARRPSPTSFADVPRRRLATAALGGLHR